MHRRLVVIAVITASLLCLASSASAAPIAPYDGDNPFRCKTQNTGFGVDYPNPEADPFCVKYNKTQQNVTELGIVDFLLNEPARVAAAVPKCFYHQTDHWTGWIVQGQQELWNWEGRYFFDKARGMGGVYVQNVARRRTALRPAHAARLPARVPAVLRPRRRRRLHGHGRSGADVRREGGHAARGEAGLPAGWRYPE